MKGIYQEHVQTSRDSLQFRGWPESYEKTLLMAVSQFWGQPFQNVQRFKKGPQNSLT